MAFRLGSERRDIKGSSNVSIAKGGSFNSSNVKIINTPLDKGTIAEANNDGTISINSEAKISKPLMKRVIKHEMKHLKDMEEGRADYGENWVMWEDNIYFRRNGMIDGPNGRLPEGHKDHPWEQEAIAAEKE
jgi:ribosomal protein S17